MHEWSRPTIHTTTGHRQASWIELFFDLVFIASLVEAIHFVEAHLSEGIMSTLLLFLVFFIAPWIVWRSTTFYSDRYEENTSRHRLLLIVLMMRILNLSLLTINLELLRAISLESSNLSCLDVHMTSSKSYLHS